jgi:hypothetical protein
MANCVGTSWRSTVTVQTIVVETADIIIDTEDAHGNFEGRFQVLGGPVEAISGRCTGFDILFVRPKAAPRFLYNGILIFVGPKVFTKGKRTQIGFPLEEVQSRFVENTNLQEVTISAEDALKLAPRMLVENINVLAAAADDWIAEKTGT